MVLYSDGGVLSRFINTDQLFSSCRGWDGSEANTGKDAVVVFAARVRGATGWLTMMAVFQSATLEWS